MNFDLVEFQSEIKQILLNTRNKNRLSHAYIFQGQNGVGKRDMALFFAQMLYQKDVDYNSNVSRQIINNEHVNVIVIESDTKVIKKEQIVALQTEFSRTSQVEGPRIYIIIDADKMNPNSQNSLLKFIEEPEEGIYGILCTTNISQILPTITSRCQIINFKALDEEALIKSLINDGVDKNMAYLLSTLTKSKEEAKALSESEDIVKLKMIFEELLKLRKPKDAAQFRIRNMAFFDKIENVSRFINILIALYEDLLILQEGSLKIHLQAYANELAKLKEVYSKDKVKEIIEFLYSSSRKLLVNVAPKNVAISLFVNIF